MSGTGQLLPSETDSRIIAFLLSAVLQMSMKTRASTDTHSRRATCTLQ